MIFKALPYRGKTGAISTLLFTALGVQFALVALSCAVPAQADVINFTILNATYTATCVGGGSCSEVINGSALLNTATGAVSNVALNLTGSLNAALNGFGTPPVCNQGSCTQPPVFYDLGAHSGQSPIEWNPTLNGIPALTPTNFGAGSLLTVPAGCGGDQPNCNTTGSFPASATIVRDLVSGKYTAVDETLNNLLGGSPSSPVFLVSSSPVAEVAGTITGGQEDFYSFLWGGGAFSATTTITNALSTDSFLFSAGTIGTCSSVGSQPLNNSNSFTGTISQGNLAAGTYCIGVNDLSGGDPTFSIDFATAVSAPEPSSFVLLVVGLGLIGLRLNTSRRTRLLS